MSDTHHSEAQQYLNRGAKSILEGRYEDAEKAYRQAIAIEPDSPWVNCNLGRSLLYQEKVEAAILYLQKSIELDSSLAEAHYSLGNAFTKQNSFEKAVKCYHAAIELIPDRFLYHHQLGDSFLLQEKYEAAIDPYRKALKLNAEYAWSYHNLGKVLSILNKWKDANLIYQAAVDRWPANPDFHYGLGQAKIMRGKTSEGISEYRRSFEIRYSISAVQERFSIEKNCKYDCDYRFKEACIEYDIGQVLESQYKWNEAVHAYKKSIAIQPDFAESYHALGEIYFQQEKWEKAIIAYNKALEYKPELHLSIYLNLGNAIHKQQAQNIQTQLVQLSEPYLEQKSQTDTIDEEIEAYKTLVKINPHDAITHQKLGEALKRRIQRDTDRALEYYDAAIQLVPDELTNYYQAIDIQPYNIQLYLKLSNLLLKKNKINQAIVFCQIAKQIQPDDRAIQKQLDKILQARGSLERT